MSCQEAVRDENLIGDHDPKAEAEQPRRQGQTMRKLSSAGNQMKSRSDTHSDQHHARDGSGSEHKQVSDGPAGIANGREHKQCCRSRASEPMHNSNYQWAYRLVELESLQAAVEPGHGSFLVAALVRLRLVAVVVTVNIVAVAVRVGPYPEPLFARYGRACARPLAAALAAGRYKTSAFLQEIGVHWLSEAELRALDPELLTLANVNTPEDLAAARSRAGD